MDDKKGNHLVVSREPGWIHVHATKISVKDLISVGRIIGVIE